MFGRSWLFAVSVCALMTYASAASADAAKLVREFSSSKTGYGAFLIAGLADRSHALALPLTCASSSTARSSVTTSNDEFDALVDGNSRSYAVCVFADSTQYRNSGKLELAKRLENVATASKAILKHQKSTEGGVTGNFIVTRVVLEDSRATFGRMGVVGLPFFGCIPSSFPVTHGKNIELPNRFMYPPGPVEDMKAQDIADFIGASTGIDIGEPQMEPRSPFLPFVVLFFLGNLAIIGYKLSNSWLIHYMPLYICGSLLVYWFSVSGGMFNIIRGMPFVGVDRRWVLDLDPRYIAHALSMPTLTHVGLGARSFVRSLGLVVRCCSCRVMDRWVLRVSSWARRPWRSGC